LYPSELEVSDATAIEVAKISQRQVLMLEAVNKFLPLLNDHETEKNTSRLPLKEGLSPKSVV
jgi:hypothetical protein